MSEKTTLEGLVCQGRTKEAIDELKSLIKNLSEDPYNNLLALSGRYTTNRKEGDGNTSPAELTNLESNRIRAAFLNVLSEVREEIQSKINFFKPIPRAVKDRDTLRDFIDTVLSRKYHEVMPFNEGNSFIYFSAKEKDSEQDVVIMVLKSSDIEEIRKSGHLNRISQLKHRNLIQLLDVNFQTYPYYIITEYVSGVSLKTLLANTGPFPLHNAKRLLLIIGDVMDYLRQKKFVHSGIRPSKIIIDHELEPEISPFDILRVSASKRLVNSFIEDSYYFAPERLHDVDRDVSGESTDRANQFCLATLAYEILTGEKLFAGSNLSEILLTRHRFFTDPEFRQARLSHPRLTGRMPKILKKMLAENPDKRYEDLSIALQEIAKLRAVLDEHEEIVFSSYRRCLGHSDNFIQLFFDNLFAQTGMESLRPETKKEQEALYQRFHITIHLLFDVENALAMIERITRLLPGKYHSLDNFLLVVNVFMETVRECDPRWSARSSIGEAWDVMKNRVLDAVTPYLTTSPVAEQDSGPSDPEGLKPAEKDTPETPVAVAPDLGFPPGEPGQNGAGTGTEIKVSFDPEKA